MFPKLLNCISSNKKRIKFLIRNTIEMIKNIPEEKITNNK